MRRQGGSSYSPLCALPECNVRRSLVLIPASVTVRPTSRWDSTARGRRPGPDAMLQATMWSYIGTVHPTAFSDLRISIGSLYLQFGPVTFHIPTRPYVKFNTIIYVLSCVLCTVNRGRLTSTRRGQIQRDYYLKKTYIALVYIIKI